MTKISKDRLNIYWYNYYMACLAVTPVEADSHTHEITLDGSSQSKAAARIALPGNMPVASFEPRNQITADLLGCNLFQLCLYIEDDLYVRCNKADVGMGRNTKYSASSYYLKRGGKLVFLARKLRLPLEVKQLVIAMHKAIE